MPAIYSVFEVIQISMGMCNGAPMWKQCNCLTYISGWETSQKLYYKSLQNIFSKMLFWLTKQYQTPAGILIIRSWFNFAIISKQYEKV